MRLPLGKAQRCPVRYNPHMSQSLAESAENSPLTRPPLPGYRLENFEVFNWGTFDSQVHAVRLNGHTTLLVGENGSGKSTLVDALLTLLVRPQTRNYNVAAGAGRRERDEKTYIRGAYDRTLGVGGTPQVQYLRSGQGTFTALLATFANAATGHAFTLLQVLYLTADGSADKTYAFAEGRRHIADDLQGLRDTKTLAKDLADRGYRTTASYNAYARWLQKATGIRDKAMDVLNQTVAVKDVQKLDQFIRDHMLERQPYTQHVRELLNHFHELSETYRILTRAQRQQQLLEPVLNTGRRYSKLQREMEAAEQTVRLLPLAFDRMRIDLLEPMCATWRERIKQSSDEVSRLDEWLRKNRRDAERLRFDIEESGGQRLRELPQLIERQEELRQTKQRELDRFLALIAPAGIRTAITSPSQLTKVREQIATRTRELQEELRSLESQHAALQYEIGTLTRQLQADRDEYEELNRRKQGNLPPGLLSVRDRICDSLQIAPSELQFAAELIAVDPQHREWESSIELVLSGFAKSLLVRREYYARVSGYIDRERLVSDRGQGQRLVYLLVDQMPVASDAEDQRDRLAAKLMFRDKHPLASWIRGEIRRRFDYQTCEDLDSFQAAKGAAMTRQRHIKHGGSRHEKDDRPTAVDRRHFILGWDNRAKREMLREAIAVAEQQLNQQNARQRESKNRMDAQGRLLFDLQLASNVSDFEALHPDPHAFEADQLRLEMEQLEKSNDQVVALKKRLADLHAEITGYEGDRDDELRRHTQLQMEYQNGERMLQAAQRRWEQAIADNGEQSLLQSLQPVADAIDEPLTLENIALYPDRQQEEARRQLTVCRDKVIPAARELSAAMSRFLKAFPDEDVDLIADPSALASFQALAERIIKDDLPRYRERFQLSLTQKVLQEIGIFRTRLENECHEIREKIESLNTALRRLQWKTGTHMRLEPAEINDREIVDFRRELAACLDHSLDRDHAVDDQTFKRIEQLAAKLQDESLTRWRDKVIDVRQWFTFAAREIVTETGESRSVYDGGTGQSGGEKGKLAFLVLAAAIAYQYDIDPDDADSQRLHFVMVDEMFSRSDDAHARYALDLFHRFGLQLLIVAPLDAKSRVAEQYAGVYLHVSKDSVTNRSQLLTVEAEQIEGQE